ncbi:MAG: ABC transporter substrate-binding protein [Erysipelotrichaceae bacterium]
MMFKKAMMGLLALTAAFSMTACSSDSGSGDSESPDKIVVWTLAEDLKQFGTRYTEQTGVEVEVVVIAPADYATKINAALGSRSKDVDIIVGEPQMLTDFMDAGFFANLSEAPYNADQYADQIVDYIYEAGKDEDGNVRALSYQATPGGVIYRRDIAQAVWGNDDPEFVSSKFKDYATIEKTAEELAAKNKRIFGDTGALRWFANATAPWVKDGKLIMSESRDGYFDAAVKLFQEELVAFAPEWSAAWYASMNGELPMHAEWSDLDEVDPDAEKTEIFSYVMPSWGSVIIRDNAVETQGKFGVASGPSSFFGGGTFVGINEFSTKKDAAWDFIKFVALNEETAAWWSEASNGDVVSNKAVLEANKELEIEAFGGQKTYEFFLEEAKNIDFSMITRYDDQIGVFFGNAIESVQKGTKTKEQAIKDFYTEVGSVFPEIELPK